MFKTFCSAFLLVLALAARSHAQADTAPTTDPAPGAVPLVPAHRPGDGPVPRGPENDNCNTPTIVVGSLVSIEFNNALATTGVQGQNAAACSFNGATGIANDQWFTWTATATGLTTLRSCGSTNADTKAAVYLGVGCPQGAPITCSDDSCREQTTLTFASIQGQTYTFQIGKKPGAPNGLGSFLLIAPGAGPPNDNCANATPISAGSLQFSTFGATTGMAVQPACGDMGAEIWYRYTATSNSLVQVSTCGGATFDTVLAAYSGVCGNLTPLACNNNACDSGSTIYFDARANQSYLIRIGGTFSDTGSGVITVAPGPPCRVACPPGSTPEGEPCGAATNDGCTLNAPLFQTLDCNAVICGSIWAENGSRDTDWYRFSLTQNQAVSLSLSAELPATLFLIQIINQCQEFNIIASADTPPCGAPAVINRLLTPGSYFVVVTPTFFESFPCGSRNAYVLTAGLGRPCPQQEPFFAGMRHDNIGVAQLELGSIIISNTGGSGTNGASVDVGDTAEGWRGEGFVPAGPLPPAASLVAAATGTVAGIINSTIGVARVDVSVNGRAQFTPDFSPISSPAYTLQAFNGDTLVFSGAGFSGAAFDRANNGVVNRMAFACRPADCAAPPCTQSGPFVPVFECAFPFAAQFQVLNGGPLVSADRFVLTPETPDTPITAISEVAIIPTSVDPLVLDAESLVFRRLFHTALGDARFDASGGQLGLDNLADAADGVRVELSPDTTNYIALLESLGDPADPGNPIPNGAFIEYTARGIVNGVPDTVYSRSRYTDVGSEILAEFDFTFTGTDQLRLNFLETGGNVGTRLIAGAEVDVAVQSGWVETLEKTYDACGRLVCQRPCRVPAAGMRAPDGAVFDADQVEVIALRPTNTFDGYTSAQVVFSQIPSVQIISETVELATGVCCACDFNDNGTLNSQDFFDFVTCFFSGACPGKRTADYNNDTLVNSQDFFDFLSCFFAPPKGCG